MTKYKQGYFRIRKNGSKELRLRKNNINISFYGKTYKEAIEKYESWIKDNKQKKNKEKFISLNEWYIKWLELYKIHKIKPNSIKTLKISVEKHFISKLGTKDIKKITIEDLQKIVNDMSNMGNTRDKVYAYIKEIFKKAKINNIIKEDIAIYLEIKKAKSINSKELTKEEQLLLLKMNNDIYKTFILFILYTGTRVQEAKTFKLNDIENNTISIHGTKTDNSERTIPYFDNIKILLKEYKNNNIFKEVNTNKAYHKLKDILPNHTLRDLRKTFATNCHTIGISPKVVQKWLGHTTVDMTMNTYTGISNELEQNSINIFNKNIPQFTPQNNRIK